MNPITHCASCDAQIFFALTRSGKEMPIDAQPVTGGNVIFDDQSDLDGTVRVRVVSAKNPAPEGAERYVSHFTTCPAANFHRRPR